MTYENVMRNLNDGKYDTTVPYPPSSERFAQDHIFDEEKSVKWNREEVVRRNAIYEANKKAHYQDGYEKEKLFKKDLIQAIVDENDFDEKGASIIYSKAYADGHAYGYNEVIIKAETLADFVNEVMGR